MNTDFLIQILVRECLLEAGLGILLITACMAMLVGARGKTQNAKESLWVLARSLKWSIPLSIMAVWTYKLWPLVAVQVQAHRGGPAAQMQLAAWYLGGDAYLKPSRPDALVWGRRAAERGHVPAQMALLLVLRTPGASEEERCEAREWGMRAGAAGEPNAYLILAQEEKNPRTREGLLKMAVPGLVHRAEEGDPDACFQLGRLLLEGRGVSRDPMRGLALWMAALDRGIGGLNELAIRDGLKSYGKEDLEVASMKAKQLRRLLEGFGW